jgi:hypothetical protein
MPGGISYLVKKRNFTELTLAGKFKLIHYYYILCS